MVPPPGEGRMRPVFLTIAKLIVCLAVVVASSSLAAAGSSVRKEQVMAQRVSAELKAALSLEVMPKQELNALIHQAICGGEKRLCPVSRIQSIGR